MLSPAARGRASRPVRATRPGADAGPHARSAAGAVAGPVGFCARGRGVTGRLPMSDDSTSLEDFSGTVRLFPLPNLVLFPHVIQPLHIFEPRYRQLMADALKDDRLMAMALLRPGWDKEDQQSLALYPVVCLGRIFKEERLNDGRYNLLLHGLSRARLVE